MSFKWGNTDLYILMDTYAPPWADAIIDEIALLPDPSNIDAISTVVQQGGRHRQTVSFSAYVKTYSVYQGFLADYLDGTQRTFTGPDSYSETVIISTLTPATRKIYPTRFEFTVTMMEM